MKKLFFLLLILPELILSQSISISGSSNQNNGTTLLPLENGEFIPSKIQGRNSNIGIYYNQSISLPIGYYTLLVGAEYNNSKINYDFSETNLLNANYEEKTEAIIPYIALQYRVLNIPNRLNAYASIGAQVYLSSLVYTYADNVFEDYTYDYNLLIPFLGAGVNLRTQYFSINPFINYQIDPIYFNNLNEINSEAFETAFESAGIVTGVRFNIGL